MSGIKFTKNLLQKTYHHGKQALGILDQGVKTGAGIYEAAKASSPESSPRGHAGWITETGHAR